MKKLLFVFAIILISNFSVAEEAQDYEGVVLSITHGGLDYTDGLSRTCDIYTNHPDLGDLDDVLDAIDAASEEKIEKNSHEDDAEVVPSLEIYATQVYEDEKTGKEKTKSILLFSSYDETEVRLGDDAFELRELAIELCDEE